MVEEEEWWRRDKCRVCNCRRVRFGWRHGGIHENNCGVSVPPQVRICRAGDIRIPRYRIAGQEPRSYLSVHCIMYVR